MTNGSLPLCAAAAAAALLLAACGGDAGESSAGATTTHTPKATPAPQQTTPPGAIAVVSTTVVGGNPRLMPTIVPNGMLATVDAHATRYRVTYADDAQTRSIVIVVDMATNPTPLPANAKQTSRQFRGQQATYVVDDPGSPTSRRVLQWQEQGDWSPPLNGQPGIPYVLTGTGLSENDFFQVANSLQPVP
jgi:hypothetical protein